MDIDLYISELRSGDHKAFQKLVDSYRQKVFNTAISLVLSNDIAEEIAQEVFITVYKSINSFNEKSSLSTWIYRITVNKCLDHLRAKKRQKFYLFSQLFTTAAIENKPAFDHPGIKLENRETARQLFLAIETLSHNQKTAFVLAYVEELSQKEIAAIMDLSVNAVESLIQRAKVNLRKKLSGMYSKEK